jgi:hypothetical protein
VRPVRERVGALLVAVRHRGEQQVTSVLGSDDESDMKLQEL